MKSKRSHKQDKLAKLYDAEILPIWSSRFARMLLRDLALPPKPNVLDVGCGTGGLTLELIRRMDDHGRIIAIDPSSAMLDVAREKAGPLSGRRIFFRSEDAEPRMSFADEVYDLVVANLSLLEMEQPAAALAEMARVTKPSGRVLATVPLAGSFGEFTDIYREVLIKRDRLDALERLDDWLKQQLTHENLENWAARAGLVDVTVEEEHFTLLFKSSREFFFAPLIEFGWLPEWKSIAGKGPEMQDVFWHIKEAIDAYFGGSSFNVTVVAGCLRARKPSEEERRLQEHARLPALGTPPPEGDADEEKTSEQPAIKRKRGDDDEPRPDKHPTHTTNQIVLGTGEIEIIEEDDGELAINDEDHFDPDRKPTPKKSE